MSLIMGRNLKIQFWEGFWCIYTYSSTNWFS